MSLMPTESDHTDEEEETETEEEEETETEEEEPVVELSASAKAEIAQRVLESAIYKAERELHEARLLDSHNNVIIAYGC